MSNRQKIKLLMEPIALSFCITCKNRFHQIKETLPVNLHDNAEDKDRVEFILVDFGSQDGLQEWIANNFEKEIDEGYLKYFYTEEMPYWHASIAKNTSHILANNDIVVNLDCDNYTGVRGGQFLLDKFKIFGPHRVFHQFSNNYGDGSYGRIAMTKQNFIKIGGYDESFEPMGYEDTDLLVRLSVIDVQRIQLADAEYSRAIPNSKEEGLLNVNSNLNWKEMRDRNFQLSFDNITHGRLVANLDKGHIGIIENIYTF